MGVSVRSCSFVIPQKRWKRNVKEVSKNVALSLKRYQQEMEGDKAARTAVKGHHTLLCLACRKESPKWNLCLLGWDSSKSRNEKSQPHTSSTLITGSAHTVCLQV